MKALIVEDEFRLADLIRDWLIKENYQVDISIDGEEGYFKAISEEYDIIILDVMLPGMNGFEILKKVRKDNSSTQILMLTAKSELDSKVFGLDSGADDYLTKPFEMEELLARIRVLLRRNKGTVDKDILICKDLRLNTKNHLLTTSQGDASVTLAEKEFRLMEYFMLNQNQILSKEQISLRIWGYESNVEYNSAEVYVSFLRKKLNYLESRVGIRTIRQIGYQIEEKHDS